MTLARDYNYGAALLVAGGNQNLAEAMVALRFVQSAAGKGPDAN
jgi:hypothetical protein